MLTIILSTLFYFLVYCFLGWLIEGTFNILIKGTFFKDSFLLGPFKPMYGFASIFLVWAYIVLPFPFFLLAALIIPTVIEYVTACLMIAFFNKYYWDYSHEPFNYQGLICMRFSFAWAILAGALVFLVHPFITNIYRGLYPLWMFLAPLFMLYFIVDLLLSVKSKRSKPPKAGLET